MPEQGSRSLGVFQSDRQRQERQIPTVVHEMPIALSPRQCHGGTGTDTQDSRSTQAQNRFLERKPVIRTP